MKNISVLTQQHYTFIIYTLESNQKILIHIKAQKVEFII